LNTGKSTFRTEAVDLDKTEILGISYSFTSTGENLFYVWAKNDLPVFNLLTSFGLPWAKTQKFGVRIIGYYKPLVSSNAGGSLMGMLYQQKSCDSCSSPIEQDEFTGNQYVSKNVEDSCILCDLA